MRDRETDSWWSIMTSKAIGGEMEGAELVEMPVGTKTTFGEWRREHPDTLVLSVDGEEHVESDPYATYFASDDTFRGLEVADTRLAPKEPVFGFFVDGRPFVAAHASIAGGRLVEIAGEPGGAVLLFREKGASLFDSTRAYRVGSDALRRTRKPRKLLEAIASGDSTGFSPIGGIDTFWYNWAAVNEGTTLLK